MREDFPEFISLLNADNEECDVHVFSVSVSLSADPENQYISSELNYTFYISMDDIPAIRELFKLDEMEYVPR